jgi:GT2 family glycosyltransferase
MGSAFRQDDRGERAFIGSLNMGCRADVFRQLPFDERYPFASEDRDWSHRFRAGGYRMSHNLEAVVVHTRRDDLAGFLRRYERYGQGAYLFRKIHSGGRPASGSFYTSMVRTGFSHGPRVGALVILSQVATAIGFARAARADRRASRATGRAQRSDHACGGLD